MATGKHKILILSSEGGKSTFSAQLSFDIDIIDVNKSVSMLDHQVGLLDIDIIDVNKSISMLT
ncbi:hypothetical protein Tco_1433813, partial [Tanacetum coccineum]